MSDWSGYSVKHLRQFLRKYNAQLAHKQAVMDKHFYGTAAYTWAAREAAELEARIAAIEAELERREETQL